MIYSKALDQEIDVISIRDVLDTEIWECDRDQANTLVREHRSEAWRIWIVEEIDLRQLADPETLQSIIEKKRAKPGPYLQ